jgi:3-oxoacyl-[acyl-carrier protein] reductase
MEFQGKGVLVTGAAGVFGRWISAAFAREGAKLCLSDIRMDGLEELRHELGLDPTQTILHATELTEEASVFDLAAQVKARWGHADIVVNNAGIYPRCELLNLTTEAFDRMFDVNLRAPFIVSREMAKLMIAAGVEGSIINISSGGARQMRTGAVPYCTSKMALERLKIRVNVVEPGFAPGSTYTKLGEEYVAKMTARIPLGRASGPDDAPSAILYLCSSKASFITGTVLSVDGGNSIGTYEPGMINPAQAAAPVAASAA